MLFHFVLLTVCFIIFFIIENYWNLLGSSSVSELADPNSLLIIRTFEKRPEKDLSKGSEKDVGLYVGMVSGHCKTSVGACSLRYFCFCTCALSIRRCSVLLLCVLPAPAKQKSASKIWYVSLTTVACLIKSCTFQEIMYQPKSEPSEKVNHKIKLMC